MAVVITLLSGCGKDAGPTPVVSDYTKLATDKKVLLEPAKLTPGTIEYICWHYFDALEKKNRKLASSFAAEYNKSDIAYEPAWKNLQRRYLESDFDFKKKFYIKIEPNTTVKGNRIKGLSHIYGYSKKDKKEASVEFSLTFVDGTVKIGR
jgi:hypothetical protein